MSLILLVVPLIFLIVNLSSARLVLPSSLRPHLLSVFALGAIGWLLAYLLRLIPLQVLQVIFLLATGADLSNESSIQAHSMSLIVLVWGPLLAGLFEGYFRYWTVRRKKNLFRLHRRTLSVVMGLGWSTGEIIVIFVQSYLSNLSQPINFDMLDLLPGILERISATLLHVALSTMVVYALFAEDRKISLWVVMLLHSLFDFTVVIFLLTGDHGSSGLWVFEIFLLVLSTILLLFALRIWVPHRESVIRSSSWLAALE